MLKLKRVEIQGFKSFYDRTEMKFNGSGIAAVVGPNGCGKSNLSDAISWVLGEQSAKSLRGARMEDVIFAGTRDRKALSMASVTMTLVPDETALTAIHLGLPEPETPSAEQSETVEIAASTPDAALNGDAHVNGTVHAVIKAEVVKAAEKRGEITITRRLFRSGDSEYLINGKSARLRDIQDLFLGTGLGPESYAIIEQGRIGQILSNKPQDRRNVIEEAAGITKFKARKRLAEARLESAKQNLSRVFDILEEVTRQVNSLKRQAAKTKRYGELKSEAVEYLRQVLAAKFRTLERESARLAIELNLVSTEVQTAQSSVGEFETQQTTVLEQAYRTEEDLRTVRKTLADLQVEAERARGKVEYQAKQAEQIKTRLAHAQVERESLSKQQEERAAEHAQQTAALAELDEQSAAAKEQLQGKAAERQAAQNRLTEQERGLEALRQGVLRLLQESSQLKNRLTQAEAQSATAERDMARARAEDDQSSADLKRIQGVKAQISDKLQARQTELISLTDQREEIESELTTSRARLGEARQALDRVRSEHSRVKARRDSLENIIEHRSYTTETVKRLFTAAERGTVPGLKPAGVLADFLEVDAAVEKATEEFLHDELESVVVEDWSSAQRGIELMRGEIGGRATFLVESLGENGASSGVALPGSTAPGPEQSGIVPLTAYLRLTNGLTHLPFEQLARIARCYVAETRETAQSLAPQFPHCWFLTMDGISYQGQSVSGGKKTGAGPLALKRELREVRQAEQTKERELAQAQSQLAELERTIAALSHQLEAVRAHQQAQEKDVLALDHESRKMAEEFNRIESRLSNARLELERLGRDRARLEETLERDRAALEQTEAKRAEQEAALENARYELTDLQQALAHASEEHAALRASMASLEERQRSLATQRQRLENQLRDLHNRQAHLANEGERMSAEHAQLSASNTELQTRREQLAETIGEHEREAAQLTEQEAAQRARLAQLDEQLKGLRSQVQTAQDRRSETQVALARTEADLKHLEETCANELEATLADVAAAFETVPEGEALAGMEAKYQDVRRKIEALGPVNPQALEEFEEAQQRQDFLTAQRQDLLDSIRDTEKALFEIDGESKKRFLEAFKVVNGNFKDLFSTLFGGGTAEMRLTDEENASESGIDIIASPPGKKLQSVLLLSGGEKSLTAMALLMAIFQYTPSPFCVLDEVDAPLDEPNTERLTRLIRDMSEQTQFIVITHSKRTMEAAQALYGVTMQEPGVSKLVSVKFRAAEVPRPAQAEPELDMAMAT